MMPRFAYRAVGVGGQIEQGFLLAEHEQDLARHLRDRRVELIEARVTAPRSHGGWSLPLIGGAPIRPWQRVALFEQMADMLASGLPLVQVLDIVRHAQPSGRLRDALADIAQGLQQGQSLATVCLAATSLFDASTAAIIASGEASGELAATFAHLAVVHRARQMQMERTIRMIRYPAFLLVVVIGVISFLMMAVIPEILLFLDQNGGTPSWLSRALITVAGGAAVLWPWVLAVVVVGAVVITTLRRHSRAGALWIDRAMLSLPYVRHVVVEADRARFVRNLAVLYARKLDIVQALRLSRGVLRNHALQQDMTRMMQRVHAGVSVATVLAEWLPPPARAIVIAGETTGLLDKSLMDVAAMLERDLDARIDRFLALLEPSLTIVMGIFLIWIIMAVLGPLYGSLSLMKVVG